MQGCMAVTKQRTFKSLFALVLCVSAAAVPAAYAQWNDNSPASVLEKYMAGLVNKDRIRDGKAPLPVNSKLSSFARGYAEEMVRTGKFSHVNKQGLNPQQRANLAGIECGVYENLGWQKNRGTPVQMIDGVEKAFMDEPIGPKNHRYNILFPDHYCMGLGIAIKKNELYAVQVFTDVEPAGSQSRPVDDPVPMALPPQRLVPQSGPALGPSGDPSKPVSDMGLPDETGSADATGSAGATVPFAGGAQQNQSQSSAPAQGGTQNANAGAAGAEAGEIQPEDAGSKEDFESRRKRFLQKDRADRMRDDEVHNDLED